MRAKVSACLVLVPLLLVECSAQSSFRTTATNLLKESPWFKVPKTANVPSGKYCYSPERPLQDEKAAVAELHSGARTPVYVGFLFGVVTAKPRNVTEQVRLGPIPAECQQLLQELIARS